MKIKKKIKKIEKIAKRQHAPFLAWVDFHARSRFARSTIREEKWGTTRSLKAVRSIVNPVNKL